MAFNYLALSGVIMICPWKFDATLGASLRRGTSWQILKGFSKFSGRWSIGIRSNRTATTWPGPSHCHSDWRLAGHWQPCSSRGNRLPKMTKDLGGICMTSSCIWATTSVEVTRISKGKKNSRCPRASSCLDRTPLNWSAHDSRHAASHVWSHSPDTSIISTCNSWAQSLSQTKTATLLMVGFNF